MHDKINYHLIIMPELFKPPFRRFIKKQSKVFQLIVEDEVDRIAVTPAVGEEKKGDLAGFKVHKFKFQKQEYLMAYTAEGNEIIFYMIGTHENFYRDFKKYVKEGE